MTKLENLVASQSKVIAISKDDISKLKTNMTNLENLVASQSKVISSQYDLINKLSSELLFCCFDISKFPRKFFKVNNK